MEPLEPIGASLPAGLSRHHPLEQEVKPFALLLGRDDKLLLFRHLEVYKYTSVPIALVKP